MKTGIERDPALSAKWLAADVEEHRRILEDFLGPLSPGDWQRPTEAKAAAWTVQQAVAHVTSTAQNFRQALEDTLAGVAFVQQGFAARTDLLASNAAGIAAREVLSPPALMENLLDTLAATARRTATLTPDQLALPLTFPGYNRPCTVADVVASQLIHPGIVHGAQLPNGVGARPLWTQYDSTLMHRQLVRFFRVLSYTYWPERGGKLRATMNYRIGGPEGGRWHVRMDPSGGGAGVGAVPRAAVNIWMRNADVLCRFAALQVTPIRATLTGQMFTWGNLLLGLRVPTLFMPT